MKDNEIIKALECCLSDSPPCAACKYDGNTFTADECMGELMKDALDLINRQKAENEALKLINSTYDAEVSQIREIAFQEFAERLLERKYLSVEWSHGGHPYVVEEDDIEDVLTELTERKEDEGK